MQNPTSASKRVQTTKRFEVDDIQLLADTFKAVEFAVGSPWDSFREARLRLPDWFRLDLPPLSEEYAAQQHRLWATITGITRGYQPELDETEAPWSGDPVRLPGGFVRRDPAAVEVMSDHIIATGMIMKYSGLRPGDRALEYGAGFGQTALQLARLGVEVDTVDISQTLCNAVCAQAEFFRVPLRPFRGRFGWNPRGTAKYDLIWFYESFHHCLDFRSLVHAIKGHLKPAGRIILAGEPIVRERNADIPYPWGIRLDSGNIAVMRAYSWFELGFTEDFLVELFVNAGYSAQRMVCASSTYGEGYVFRIRPASIALGAEWLPHDVEETWHGAEETGRWSKGESHLYLDTSATFGGLLVEAQNHHPVERTVEVEYGGRSHSVTFRPRERREFTLPAATRSPRIVFRTRTMSPARDYPGGSDTRELGIFVRKLSYL
jgi:2-polyprenyl-3-methyl-5-hydroxy-6-metoxy-1,4-benzoquinol methylase